MVLTANQKAAAKKVARAKRAARNAAAAAANPRPQPTPASDEQVIAPPTQQRLLDVFERSFAAVLGPEEPSIDSLLQEIKAALFARDFAAAFENARPELLEAYAARWSPTRALGYAAVLAGLEPHLDGITSEAPKEASPAPEALRVVSIGGGAAEVAALAGLLLHHNDGDEHQLSASITLIDSAPWSPVVSRLHADLTTPPPLSKYASAAAKAANAPLVAPDLLFSTFVQADVLALTREQLSTHLGLAASASPQPLLVTLLFTLNELYTSGGIGKTTALLLNLSALLPAGSLLLVVDSPGSYSETTVGKESKRYPMHWLLEHCLLRKGPKPAEDDGCLWEKLESDESSWFRMHESLRYPIPLENMRYQMHLYRATRPQ